MDSVQKFKWLFEKENDWHIWADGSKTIWFHCWVQEEVERNYWDSLGAGKLSISDEQMGTAIEKLADLLKEPTLGFSSMEEALEAAKNSVHFQWVWSQSFALHEAGKCHRFLTEEQSKELRLKYCRSRALNQLIWELLELSWSIHIEGFTGKNRKSVDLVKWATGRAAMLPTPFEDLVLSPLKAEPAETYDQRYDKREKEIHRLFEKYVKGLLLLPEKADEDAYPQEEEQILVASEMAMYYAELAFHTWIEGISFAYDWLNKKHDSEESPPKSVLANVYKAQGAVQFFLDRGKSGRKKLEEDKRKMQIVARAIGRKSFEQAMKRKNWSKDMITWVTLLANKKFNRTYEPKQIKKWIDAFSRLPEEEREELFAYK